MARAGVGKLVGGKHPAELVSLGACVTAPRSEEAAGTVVTDDDLPCGTRGRLSEFVMSLIRGIMVGYLVFRVWVSGLRELDVRFPRVGYPVRASRISGSRVARLVFVWPLCAMPFARKV